jgi:ATP-binding cassette subfamily D (ALD) long-chain fatty acid import protein
MLALHSAFLLLRTGISLYVADLDGRWVKSDVVELLLISRIVSTLVTNQPHLFLANLAKWLAIAIPATFTNSMLEYLQSELGLAYRTRQGSPSP